MNTIKNTLIHIAVIAALVTVSVTAAAAQKRVTRTASETLTKQEVTAAGLLTEKSVYARGEMVALNGRGYQKFESVTIRAARVGDTPDSVVELESWTVFADQNGHLDFTWQVPFEGKFVLQATGDESKVVSQVTVICPIVVNGNPSCATLNASTMPDFAHITTNFGIKIDPPASGNHPFTNGSGRFLTGGASANVNHAVATQITNRTFNWSSTRPISAVIVKGGPKANVYPYNPLATADTGLTTVNGAYGISHIEFCFAGVPDPPASITIVKDSQPNTPQVFNFSATGQVNQNFSLSDNGTVGPDRITFSNLTAFGANHAVTVSEGAAAGGYSLVQISCTSAGGTNNNTVNLPSRFVSIVLEPGEAVVCTFVNAVTTASSAPVGGRVADAYGRGIVRASVTIQNTSTGEIVSTQTNSFGRYQFDGLTVGDFYIVTVQHRKHQFTPNSQAFTLDDARSDLDFSASQP